MLFDHITIIKYIAALTLVTAMIFHTLGITPINSILQMIGAGLWCYVAIKWKEKAMLLNFLPQFFIIIPGLVYMYHEQLAEIIR